MSLCFLGLYDDKLVYFLGKYIKEIKITDYNKISKIVDFKGSNVYLIEFKSEEDLKTIFNSFDNLFLKYYINNYKSFFIICLTFDDFYKSYSNSLTINKISCLNSNKKNYINNVSNLNNRDYFYISINYLITILITLLYNIKSKFFCKNKYSHQYNFRPLNNKISLTNSKSKKKVENERYINQ